MEDIQLEDLPTRVLRLLIGRNIGAGLYLIQRVDSNCELLRNSRLIANPACFRRYEISA